MEPMVIAVIIGIAVYVGAVALIPRHILVKDVATPFVNNRLQTLESESVMPGEDSVSVLREHLQKAGVLTRVFFTLPGARKSYPKLMKAGLLERLDVFFGGCILVFVVAFYLLRGMKIWGFVLAGGIAYLAAWWYIKRRIASRNAAFLSLFPEALDMIVRSVRSGYPLNASIRIVADNMQAPVSTEFKQISDEIAYGSTMMDSLKRLSYRVDEPDVKFFVVMLSVQQEVGGNMSEVLGNLAAIIRKRRHLRMKIKALTSEGRATSWVLGLLPVFEFGAIYIFTPTHLTPLFETFTGNMVLAAAIGIVLLGMMIVRHMVNMEI